MLSELSSRGCTHPVGELFFALKDIHTDDFWTLKCTLWSCTVFGTLSHWGSWGLGDAADINLELHVDLHFLLHLPTVLSLDVPAAQWAQSQTERGLISLHLSPRQRRARLSHHGWPASSIAAERDFFFIPARVKCQWEISTRCTLTLGDHCAYWHSPHRGVDSDRLRLRRFIHAPTDTWQRQMISTSSVNSRALVLFCRRHKQELKLSSCYFERLVLWWECFHTKLILLWISKDVHLVLSVIFHSLFYLSRCDRTLSSHWRYVLNCWWIGTMIGKPRQFLHLMLLCSPPPPPSLLQLYQSEMRGEDGEMKRWSKRLHSEKTGERET